MKDNLRKDESIIRLIGKLKSVMGDNAFNVVDHWEADLFTVGIAKPDNHDVLVYVCTYGQPVGRYVVSLEFSPGPRSMLPHDLEKDFVVQGLDKLVQVIERHFSVDDQ